MLFNSSRLTFRAFSPSALPYFRFGFSGPLFTVPFHELNSLEELTTLQSPSKDHSTPYSLFIIIIIIIILHLSYCAHHMSTDSSIVCIYICQYLVSLSTAVFPDVPSCTLEHSIKIGPLVAVAAALTVQEVLETSIPIYQVDKGR